MKRAFALLCLLSLVSNAVAENWPQWRGAKGDGISHEKGLPTKWSSSEGVAWKALLPGPAGASPAVWDDRIFVTSSDDNNLEVICIGTDGKQKWSQVTASGNKSVRDGEGNFASPSPCTDGKHVWAFFGNGELACYTVDGKEVWKRQMQEEYGKFSIAFGMTSTPILDKGRLYLQLIHGEGKPETQEAKVVCLDALTGNKIWAVDRKSDGRDENEHSYASPILYRHGTTEYLVTHGNDYAIGHSLEDGHELFRVGDLNPKGTYEPTLRFVASPVAVPGFLVIPTAKNRGVVCLKADDLKGNVSGSESPYYWRRDKETPDVPSPIIVDGLVYLCRENGNLMCLDAKTGELYYNERTTPDRHRSSPIYADGHLYLCARNGKVSVVKTGKEFKRDEMIVNDLGEEISSTPAIANGRIYIRTFNNLWAIGK